MPDLATEENVTIHFWVSFMFLIADHHPYFVLVERDFAEQFAEAIRGVDKMATRPIYRYEANAQKREREIYIYIYYVYIYIFFYICNIHAYFPIFMNKLPIGGLEHGFYFPFSWECHHPN